MCSISIGGIAGNGTWHPRRRLDAAQSRAL
jgi:hypothetical protein